MNFIFESVRDRLNFISCKDINPSGIGRFGVSALLNATELYFVSNDKEKTYKFLHYSQEAENYVISSGLNHSPEDWTGYDPKVKSLFSHLNEKYLKDLRLGNAILLLDQSLEGYQTPWLWDWFHKECVEYQISPRQIVYVTGNMTVEEVYEEWVNKNRIQDRMMVIGYPHFELDMGMSCYHRNRGENPLPKFEDHINYKSNNLDSIKTFACLNKRIRAHRIWFYKYLYESNLLDKGLVSMNQFDMYWRNWEGDDVGKDTWEKISKILPLRVYGKPNDELDDSFYINRFNDQISLDTFMTVISEAHCGDSNQTMFISEKTFKVIACNHPFMIMGNKNSISKLKELGYKTFDGFIDEGYDNLPTHERLKYIIESIKKVDAIENKLEWFKSMENIIKHNYNNLVSKLFRKPEAFIKFENYHNKIFNI